MSDIDEDLVVGGDEDEDLVVGPASSALPGGGRPAGASRPRGRQWAYPTSGFLNSWLVVDSSLPPARRGVVRPPPGLESLDSPGCRTVVGVTKLRWTLVEESAEARAVNETLAGGQHRKQVPALGCMQYEISEVYRFHDMHHFATSELPSTAHGCAKRCAELFRGAELLPDLLKPEDYMDENTIVSNALLLPPNVVLSALLGHDAMVKSIRITRQLRWDGMFMRSIPKHAVRHYWQIWQQTGPPVDTPATSSSNALDLSAPRKRVPYPSDEKLKKQPNIRYTTPLSSSTPSTFRYCYGAKRPSARPSGSRTSTGAIRATRRRTKGREIPNWTQVRRFWSGLAKGSTSF